MKNYKRWKFVKNVVSNVLGITLTLIVIIPCLLVILNAFKDQGSAGLVNLDLQGVSLENAQYNLVSHIAGGKLISAATVENCARADGVADSWQSVARFEGGVSGVISSRSTASPQSPSRLRLWL